MMRLAALTKVVFEATVVVRLRSKHGARGGVEREACNMHSRATMPGKLNEPSAEGVREVAEDALIEHAYYSLHITARISGHAYSSTHTGARMPRYAYHSTHVRARISERAYQSAHVTARISEHVYHSTHFRARISEHAYRSTHVTARISRQQVEGRREASRRSATRLDCSLFGVFTRTRQRHRSVRDSNINGNQPPQFLLEHAPTGGIVVCTFAPFRCWLPWPRPLEYDCAGWETRRKKTDGNATRQQTRQASDGPLRRVARHCITSDCTT